LKEDMTGVEGTSRVQDISRADVSRMKDMIRVKDMTGVAVTMTNTRKGDKSPVDIMKE
jgi:hypothetical protein